MKNDRRVQRAAGYLEKQYPKLKQQAAQTKDSKLWHLEAVVRNKLKELYELSAGTNTYKQISADYAALLDDISTRLLGHYNAVNKTDYRFEAVVRGRRGAYLQSGLISVLMTEHIPKLVAEEYRRLLPVNPKDEYPEARRMKRKFYLHLGETNTGKTYNALQRLKQSSNGLYLAPLRLLALENYERLNSEHVPCSLLTGEEELRVQGARHISCTVEKADLSGGYSVAVIDEVQMLADPQRGDAWTRAILGLCCPEIHLCGALNAKEQLLRMIEDCGDSYEFTQYVRQIPLKTQRGHFRLSDVGVGDALVAFSKKKVLTLSRRLTDSGIRNSVIYGDLPPEVRRVQYDAFITGKTDVLVTTDAVGMGINLPIRRIVFTETKKFDGDEFRDLTPQELKQIAGRAGRIGIYELGYVASSEGDIGFIEDRLLAPDEPLKQAVVGPSELILNVGALPLREKLALWSTREESLAYYRRKDVRDFLLVLDRLKPFKLPEAIEWRLMRLPFDVNSEELMSLFVDYVEEAYKLKADELSKPDLPGGTLSELELYYQKLNLYYAFSRAMALPFDENWVYGKRRAVCEEISELLQAEAKR